MADDELTAALAEIRPRHYRISLPGGEPVCQSDRHAWPCHAYRLLGALSAALELHQPLPLFGDLDSDGDRPCGHCGHAPEADCHFEAPDDPGHWLCRCKPEGTVCEACGDEGGTMADWPCDEYRAVARALLGEVPADG